MKKQEIANRFDIFINSLNISQKELADKIKVPAPYISKMKKGELSFEIYSEELAKLGLNLNWLYTGKGGMYFDLATNKESFHQKFVVTDVTNLDLQPNLYRCKILIDYLNIDKYSQKKNNIKLYHIQKKTTNLDLENIVVFGINSNDLEYLKISKYAIFSKYLGGGDINNPISYEDRYSIPEIGLVSNLTLDSKNDNSIFDFIPLNNQEKVSKVYRFEIQDFYFIIGNINIDYEI